VELPTVNAARCTGCGDCVAICPTQCLAMSRSGAVPWLPRPLDCVSCSVCVLVCPPDAIRLTKPA
jgi:formate hydrogenlyase subunit 6/NADH:ubiquinone oxidoreductase subunit I